MTIYVAHQTRDVVVFPTAAIGLAARLINDAYFLETKRKRKAQFNKIKRALVAIEIIPPGKQIMHIARGISRNGDHETILILEPETKS